MPTKTKEEVLSLETGVTVALKAASAAETSSAALSDASASETSSVAATSSSVNANAESAENIVSSASSTSSDAALSLNGSSSSCSSVTSTFIASTNLQAKDPWLVIINAPEDSLAHNALCHLLESTHHPVTHLVVMGAAAKVAKQSHVLGERYAALAQSLGCELLVCGMAAKNYGCVGDKLSASFTLTGFMEILSLMRKAQAQRHKVVNW